MGTASLALQSQNVIYASKNGVLFDGSDQSGAMQELCNRALSGPVTIILDGPAIKLKGVNLYSGTTIEGLGFGTVVTQATVTGFSDTYIFGNANYRSPYQGATIVDQNITIRNIYIDGNYRNGSTGTGTHAAPDGTTVTHLRFLGVNNLRVESVYVYDTAGYSVWGANLFNGTIRDITSLELAALVSFNGSTEAGCAAVQIEGPAADLLIENIYGANGDDFVALNAVDGQLDSGVPPPHVLYYGSIERVIIRGLYPVATPNIVRLLSGAPPAGGTVATIDQVLVENVVGNTYQCMFVANKFGDLGTPALGNIVLKNWTVGFLTASSGPSSLIGGNVGSFTVSGFRLSDRTSVIPALFGVDASSTVGRFVIDDVTLREDSSEATNTNPIVAITQSTVDELVVSNVNMVRNASTATSIIAISGGTVNRLELANVSGNNINNIVSVTGGTVGGINSVGLTHRGAGGGNGSIAVGTSVTVPRLRACGSDTALLVSGSGTITSKKTDATEDA